MGNGVRYVMSAEDLYAENISAKVVQLRNILQEQFNKKINLLLESKRPPACT